MVAVVHPVVVVAHSAQMVVAVAHSADESEDNSLFHGTPPKKNLHTGPALGEKCWNTKVEWEEVERNGEEGGGGRVGL